MTTATATMSNGTKDTVAAGYESELRASARRCGLTMKELAAKMGVSAGYLSELAAGRRRWTPKMRDKAVAVLGEAPGQGVVYRQRDRVSGESSYIRERARELGMNMKDLAERVGVSYGYMSEVSRGRRRMGVKLQARVESVLETPAKVAPAKRACVNQEALWSRMDAHGISQNEVARRAGVSSAHISNIMSGKATPSAEVLKQLHGVLFRPTREERVVPAEVKVLAWRKGDRHGVVVRDAGGPRRGGKDSGTVRVGGRVPWGAEVEYAYRAGYDSRGRVSVTPVVTPGYSCMLVQPEAGGA